MEFRDLTADDIEVRVQSVKQNGLVLLLYKNARVDMNVLDETVGPENWQRDHYDCKGNCYCRVGIKSKDTGEWIWKSDCGSESNTEPEKGESSDSFKRACVNWGIGRELYTSPFIWVPSDKCNIKESSNGKGFVCYDKFEVERVKIVNKRIVAISIINTSKNGDKGAPVRAFILFEQVS